jgi:sodium/potassium/calcium exchanger 6
MGRFKLCFCLSEFGSSHREPTDTEVSEEENQEQPLLGSNEHSVSVEFVAPPTKHPIVKLLLAFWPFGEAFKRLGIIGKIYEIAKIPIVLLLTLTVPVIDKDEEDDNWNRWLNILQCITAPVFISFTTKFGFEAVGGVFPGFGLALILGMALALLIALTSSNDKPPRYHCVCCCCCCLLSLLLFRCLLGWDF